jgi:hypothetical protein
MKSGENSVMLSPGVSFAEVLDKTFNRLWEWKVQDSIRRIQNMEERLTDLEQELDRLAICHGKDRAR